jgi:hypothetical protein
MTKFEKRIIKLVRTDGQEGFTFGDERKDMINEATDKELLEYVLLRDKEKAIWNRINDRTKLSE